MSKWQNFHFWVNYHFKRRSVPSDFICSITNRHWHQTCHNSSYLNVYERLKFPSVPHVGYRKASDDLYHITFLQCGKNYLIPCWFCTFAHWQRNYQSIILMVGLFEQWDRITTQKVQKNAFQKSYKLICILMSEISIWPLRKTWLSTWWQNPCWQSQRSDVSCSWPPGLHTSQEGFCPTPLCRSSPSH